MDLNLLILEGYKDIGEHQTVWWALRKPVWTNTGQRMSNLLHYKYVWPIIDQMQKCRKKKKQISLCLITGKEKGKRQYNNSHRPCVFLCYVLLTFTEVEHMRQVHPRQTLMTSEEVSLLRPPKFCHSLLASCRKQRENGPLCVCVWLSQCMFFFWQPCAEVETLYVH